VPVVRRLLPGVPDPAVPDPADPPDPDPPDAEPLDAEPLDAEPAGAAARPQTLQYPSSIVPPQLVHVLIATHPPPQPAYCATGGLGTGLPIQCR
jgi:hypothetical protein